MSQALRLALNLQEHGIMKPLFTICAVVLVAILSTTSTSLADSVSTMSAWDHYTGIDQLGEAWAGGGWISRSYGQTFKVNAPEARLNSFTFGVWDYAPEREAQACTFEVAIMEWGGSGPTGSVLYKSQPLVSPNGSTWSIMTVPLGNVLVDGDKQYLAFLTATDFMDGVQSLAMVSWGWDSYSDGAMYFHTAFGPGDELRQDWSSAGAVDMGFTLDYTPVPEPATMGLLALGGMAVIRRKR
jgi:hypothetical protein